MSNNNNSSSGIGFLGLLAIAFIILKLTKVIAWSWLWILSQLWIPVALGIVLFIPYLWFTGREEKKRELKLKSKWDKNLEEWRAAKEQRGKI